MSTMVKVKISFDGVQKCQKPGCGKSPAFRHHLGNEAMILAALKKAGREQQKEWKKWKKRYDSFHPDDIIYVCEDHHVEVHEWYDKMWPRIMMKFRLTIHRLTWSELDALKKMYRSEGKRWLKQKTPGTPGGFTRPLPDLLRGN